MQENKNLNMDIDIDKEDQRQRQLPHCSMATDDGGGVVDGDGDDYVISNRANALMSASIQRVSGASVTDFEDFTLNQNKDLPTPHAYSDPTDDVLDDVNVVTPATAASLDSDRVKLCEEGCSLSMPVDGEYDKDSDHDSNITELQPLHRHPSIVTLTPQSDLNKRVLSEDTFSFLIYSHVRSRAFFLATFVFTFQIAIYSVLAYDITNISNQRNPLKLPVGVETPVRIASVFAIVVAIITQDDVRKVASLLRDGFDQDLADSFQGATKTKWILSILLRGSEGLMGLFLTVLLIMQSTTVLDLLLNFLAMEFVSLLDDVVFVLTKEGFFGGSLQNEAKKLSNTFYHASHVWTDSRTASFVTKTYFIFLLTIMLAAWGIIFANQESGKYLCSQIFAQFSDEIMPELGTFTGFFYLHTQSFGGRSSYRDDREGSMLAYCKNETRWTLSLTKYANPCNWLAASSESTSFDVITTTSSPWVIKTLSNFEVPLTHHILLCYKCEDLNIPEKNGICKQARNHEKFDQCICNDGYYGLSCGHLEPCQIIEAEGFAKEGGGLFASRYYRLEGADTYYRPVYTSLDGNETLSDRTVIILYNGDRWIMSFKHSFPDLINITDKKKLARYFSSEFHGNYTYYSGVYESEPVYISPLGSADKNESLLSVRWRPSSGVQRGFFDTESSCAACNENYSCREEAQCLSDGTCGCPVGFSGALCEIEITPSPTASPAKCKEGSNLLTIEITPGEKPWASYWALTEQDTHIIFDGPFQAHDTRETIVKEVCKLVSACYKFRLESTDNSSALIYLDGKEIGTATTNNMIEIDESSCTAI